MLAQRRPSLHGALLAAKVAGHTDVIVDGTLIETDRIRTLDPAPGVDAWWSGKHKHHGGNVQVVSAPDGQEVAAILGQGPCRRRRIPASTVA